MSETAPSHAHGPASQPAAPTQQHLALARRISRKYRSPSHGAEDLESEAVVVLLQALPLYDPARQNCPLEAFLSTAIKSKLSRLVRADLSHRQRERPFNDDFLDSRPAREPDRADVAAELAEVLDRARELLPARQAEVIEQTARGEAPAQIAEALGLAASTVHALKSRALKTLRAALL